MAVVSETRRGERDKGEQQAEPEGDLGTHSCVLGRRERVLEERI